MPIVITAAGLLQRSADTTFPFRQDSSFWYLTGINIPDVILVLDEKGEYLIMPSRSQVQDLFDGSIERQKLVDTSGIKSIVDEAEGWERLTAAIKQAKSFATPEPPSSYIEPYGFYTNPAKQRLLERIKQQTKIQHPEDVRSLIAQLRAIKQPQEIATLRYAISVTLDAIAVLDERLSSLKTEHEAETIISGEFQKLMLDHGYEPIVASGANACTVHYIANNAPIDQSSYLLLDVGAQVDYYSADISRVLHPTVPTARQQAVHDAVEQVQQYAMGLLKPGVNLSEYETQVERFMGTQLKALKLIKSTDRDSIREYFPYLTSHFLGLDVHDVGNRDAQLQEGMVLTVEPGIHIPDEKIAVRIEDDVLITKTGIEVLSKKR
jgi:Xaa-Pro aminopeptidase